MEADRTSHVNDLFFAALKLPPDQRSAFLRSECNDETLRAEVRSLLSADARAESFLSSPLRSDRIVEPAAPPDAVLGRRIGQYTVRRVIGSGGMGVVYEAEQAHPRRTVALKLMRVGLAGTSRAARLAREADLLARLRHPGVAQIYEAGIHHEAGAAIPYFAMEYLAPAHDIVTYASRRELDCRGKLELLARVCDAVEHGHQRGVIHRDLKPGNVLVDSTGQPKVIDFGVARLVESESSAVTVRTETGELVGTLRYMSPEQCQGADGEVDTRTDVYALGVILYELLTGVFPYDVDTPSPFEVPAVIREVEPRRPALIDRTLRGDVETIVLKALAKDRERRYASVGDLARDIRRFLNHEPIDARRDSGWYVLRKAVRRHRVPIAVAATFLLVVLISAFSVFRSVRARAAQAEAFRRSLYFNRVALAQSATDASNIFETNRLLDLCPADLRGWEWHYLRWISDSSVRTFRGHNGLVNSVAYAPDGRSVASAGVDGAIYGWSVAGNEAPRALLGHSGSVVSIAISPDGAQIASGGIDGTVRLWNTAGGGSLATASVTADSADAVAFSPDGDSVVAGYDSGIVRIWDTATHQSVLSFRAHDAGICSLDWSPDGSWIVTGGYDETARIWDALTGELHVSLLEHTDCVSAVAFTPDNRQVVTGSWDLTVRLWDAETGESLATLPHEGTVDDISVSHRGLIASATYLGLNIWRQASAECIARLRGHELGFNCVAFDATGHRLASGSEDGTVKLWNLDRPHDPLVLHTNGAFVRAVAFSSNNTVVASADLHDLLLFDVPSGERRSVMGAEGPFRDVAFCHDGSHLAAAHAEAVSIWDIEQSLPIAVLATGEATSVHFMPDGVRIAVAVPLGAAQIWNFRTQRLIQSLSEGTSRIAVSPDGSLLAEANDVGVIYIHDLAGGNSRRINAHNAPINTLGFSSDGTRLLSGSSDRTIREWAVATRKLLLTLEGHHGAVLSAVFSPSGDRIVSASFDGTLKVWDASSGALALTLRGHEKAVNTVAFSADGRLIVTGSDDQTVRIWGPIEQ